ncbi:MAG: DUF935 family protein [Bacilli bacterium]
MKISQLFKKRFSGKQNTQKAKTDLFAAFATPYNRNAFNNFGYISNPNERRHLIHSIEDYYKMLFDPHVGSCVQSRKSGVLSMQWEIVSNEENTEYAHFVEEVFNHLNVRRIIEEMLDCVLYGYKPMEIYYNIKNGKILIDDIIGKPPEWFAFRQGHFVFLNNSSVEGEEIPPYKILMLRNSPSYTNPYGEAVLARCVNPLYLKNGDLELWSLFTQKYGMPFLHGKIEGGSKFDLENLATQLDNLRQDGTMASSGNIEINTIEASNSYSSDNYNLFLHFCNTEISKAILSQTLTTEQGETGSYSMSQTHLEVRTDIVKSDAAIVEYAFNQIIEWLIEMNFENMPAETPKFILYGDLIADLDLAQRDQIIFSTGYVKPTKEYLTRHHGYKNDEIEMTEPAPAQVQFAESEPDKKSLDDYDEATQQILKPIIKLIENGKTYDEILNEAAEMFGNIDKDELIDYIGDSILLTQAEELTKAKEK